MRDAIGARCICGMVLVALGVYACEPPRVHTPGCMEPPPREGLVVARVGDVSITAERLDARIKAQGQGRHNYETVRGLRELVEDEVRYEVLARAAYDRGLWRDPDVIDAARRVMVRKLLERDLEPAQFSGAVGDDALRAYYDQHGKDYSQPEKRRFLQIALPATDEGRVTAQSLIDKLQNKSDAQFTAARARYPQKKDPDAGHAGDFLTQDEISAVYGMSFATRVFEGEPGRVLAVPVQSTQGWHVVKLLAKREALARGFEDVRDQIREKLLQKERSAEFQTYIEQLRQTYPVAIYADVMQSVLVQWAGKNP